MTTIKTVGTAWTDTVLVCRKCSRKRDGGFGPDGRQPLAKVLRARFARDAEGRKLKRRKQAIGVVEVGCLGLCPKHAVTVARGRDPATWFVIPDGTPVDAIAAMLGLPPSSA